MKRLVLLSILAFAPPAAAQLQAPFVSLHCVAVGGEVAEWRGFGDVARRPLGEQQSFVIGAVDITRGTALFTSDRGTTEVRAIPLEDTMTFLEIRPSGQAFTTVFYRTREQGFYFFVHSRHASGDEAPLVSQTQGFCASVD